MTTKQVQWRRGTQTQHEAFTGAAGEVTVDTTNDAVRVHDGVTLGGHLAAKKSDIEATQGELKELEARIADIAVSTGNGPYASISDGLAATSDGDVFTAYDGDRFVGYQNDNGVAVELSSFASLQDTIIPYPSRAVFEASDVPFTATRFTVAGLSYVVDPNGTAIESANGVKGSPDGDYHPKHFGAVGDGVADDRVAVRNWALALSADDANGVADGGTYRCDGVSFSALNAGTKIDFKGATFKQWTPGAVVVRMDFRECVFKNLIVKSHDELPSNEVLISAEDCWKSVFERVVIGTSGSQGVWRVGSNGYGGYYWNVHILCEANWKIDPTVTGSYGPFGSSVNANVWMGGIAWGLEIVAPTIAPGNFQQAYSLVFKNMDMAGTQPYVNNYNNAIGVGTDNYCVPVFENCTWEHNGQFKGRCRADYSHCAAFTSGYPFDQNYPDQPLSIGTGINKKVGSYRPEGVALTLMPDGGVPAQLVADFNGAWSTVTDAAAPFGGKSFQWVKSDPAQQGTPKLVLPAHVLRQAAYIGGISIGFWCKAVSGTTGLMGFKKPSPQANSYTSLGADFGVTSSDDSEGWVYRFASLEIDEAWKLETDDIGLMLAGLDTGVASEYLYGPITVWLGRTAQASTRVVSKEKQAIVDCICDASTWATAFTISLPARDSAIYDFTAKTVGVGGRATASSLRATVTANRYDETVQGAVAGLTFSNTAPSGSLGDIRITPSGTNLLVQVRLSVWSGNPTFPVNCRIKATNEDDMVLIS